MAGLRKVEFVQSNRGKQQVLLDGYTYSQNRVNEEATYWRFPLRMWNHFTNAGPRTNNNVEGFHSRVNRLLPHRHPNIYRFVELIKGIEKCERSKLIQINAGAPPPRRRVYRELDTRVRRLKQQLTDRTKTPLQYLDAIGHLMKLQ